MEKDERSNMEHYSTLAVTLAMVAVSYTINRFSIKNHLRVHQSSQCERLKSQNNISTELEADWQSWWSCKQLPLPINSCYEAALAGWCILSSLVLELL